MSRKRHESTKFMKFNSIFYKVNSRSIKEERRGCFCSMQEMLNIKEVMKKIVQDCQRIQKTQGNSTFLGSFLFVKI